MHLEKYSFGMGDRFGRQGKAQLKAVVEARKAGIHIVPVWNKSHREHTTIHTVPASLRAEADAAVEALGWDGSYYVDADHINSSNVDGFIDSSDFFTIDVAEAIGTPVDDLHLDDFVARQERFMGTLNVPGLSQTFEVSPEAVRAIARTYLGAAREAGAIYRHIESAKGKDAFVTEVSMDETDQPQSPMELFFILAALAQEGVPLQTIAPKFSGRFNKGVDYAGDAGQFEKEFEEDVLVIKLAIEQFGLPPNLKLSVHSGSDKFSIYEPIRRIITRHDAGLHIKTAGTTWLEELIGLALSESEGLEIAKKIYEEAFRRLDDLCRPYASVIDIDAANLPAPGDVNGWDGETFAAALRHDPSCASYNPSLRQLLHVGYKVAAEMGDGFLNALDRYEPLVAEQVTHNLLNRHILPLFPKDENG